MADELSDVGFVGRGPLHRYRSEWHDELVLAPVPADVPGRLLVRVYVILRAGGGRLRDYRQTRQMLTFSRAASWATGADGVPRVRRSTSLSTS